MMSIVEYTAKAALEEGFLDQQVKNKNFKVNIASYYSGCSATIGGEVAFPLLQGLGKVPGRIHSTTEDQAPATVISGCSCSGATKVIANLGNQKVVPLVSGAATSPTLSSKALYPNFARTIPPDSMQGRALSKIVQSFSWKRVGAMYFVWDAYGKDIVEAFADMVVTGDVTVITESLPHVTLQNPGDAPKYNHTKLMESAVKMSGYRPQLRIFLLVVAGAIDYGFHAFHQAGLVTTGTAWLTAEAGCTVSRLQNVAAKQSEFAAADSSNPLWNDQTWGKIPKLMQGMLCTVPSSQGPRFRSSEWKAFVQNLTLAKLKAVGYPSTTRYVWSDSYATLAGGSGWTATPYPLLAFDAMTSIFVAVGDLLAAGTPEADIKGKKLKDAIFAARFEGLSGNVAFDPRGDRLAPYEVLNLQIVSGTPMLVRVGQYDGAADKFVVDKSLVFADGSTTVPSDTYPPCSAGFFRERMTCTSLCIVTCNTIPCDICNIHVICSICPSYFDF